MLGDVREKPSPPVKGEREGVYTIRDNCRLCFSENIEPIWSFGETPFANAYLKPEQVGQFEPVAPLDLSYCHDCHLVQLVDVVQPEILFSHYLYVSSTSPKFVAHFEEYARTLVDRFGLTSSDLVVDVGSNDGILLKPLAQAGIQVLGIDPAEEIAAAATEEGIPTLASFFTPDIARTVKQLKQEATVISANNVFAHSDDIVRFVASTKELLSSDGVFVFEVQYLKDLVEKNLFDIVYHEHTNYYHLTPLASFFKSQGLELFDVEHLPVHGGSIRVYVQFANGPHARGKKLDEMLAAEEKAGLNSINPYLQFKQRFNTNKRELKKIIRDIKGQGKKIVGYGAPAKATTLMYALGLGAADISYIVDDDKRFKQGMVMPGSHIPIVSPDMLYTDKPDYCLILAWNFAEPIMQNHKKYLNQNGNFIVPVPSPKVLSRDNSASPPDKGARGVSP